jgi:hypothetical protein
VTFGVITRDRWTACWCEERCWNLAPDSVIEIDPARNVETGQEGQFCEYIELSSYVQKQIPHSCAHNPPVKGSRASVVIQHSDGTFSFIVEKREWWMIKMTSHTCVCRSLLLLLLGRPPSLFVATGNRHFAALVCQSCFGNLGLRPCFLCSLLHILPCDARSVNSEIAIKRRTPVVETRKKKEN